MVTSKKLLQKYCGLWQMNGVYKSNKYGAVPCLKRNITSERAEQGEQKKLPEKRRK